MPMCCLAYGTAARCLYALALLCSVCVTCAAQAPPQDFVVYATGPGWLHVAPRAAFLAEQKLHEEIWGGPQTDRPLPKTLLEEGFLTAEDALSSLCSRLTKVSALYSPAAPPQEVVSAMFRGQEYRLRLGAGLDADAALFRAQEYDFAAEKAVLARYGITPRMGFRKLWLAHATGRGTVDGPMELDQWMTVPAQPLPAPDRPGQGVFVLADGFGGTITYGCDRWEGPYRDNFGMARAMKRLGIAEMDLYPPGQNYTRRVVAAEVPDDACDHGPAVLGVQAFRDPPELRDWVAYTVGDVYLRIGTRKEFETPVHAREVINFGEGDALVEKRELPLGKRFHSYDEVLEAVCAGLQNIRVGFHPLSQPRETVDGEYQGKTLLLHLARPPDVLIAGYGGYHCGAEVRLMLECGIVPRKQFKRQWLVHATGHGTYSGPVKDDFWMMVGREPRNGGVTVPDGMGGTFGYSVDQVAGPFEDNIALAAALKERGLKRIGLVGEDRAVNADEAVLPAESQNPTKPRILSVTPSDGSPGETFYVTIIAEGAKPWYHFGLGAGVEVSDETYLGRNPDGPGERWLATVAIADDAPLTSGE